MATSPPDSSPMNWPKSYTVGKRVGYESNKLEFKSKTLQNLVKEDDISKYACGFLNSEGGTLMNGVDDKGIVRGVNLSTQERDDFAKQVVDSLRRMNPPVSKDLYSIEYISAQTDDGTVGMEHEDDANGGKLVVICLHISKRQPGVMYEVVTGKHRGFFVRKESTTYCLTGREIVEFTRRIDAETAEESRKQQTETETETETETDLRGIFPKLVTRIPSNINVRQLGENLGFSTEVMQVYIKENSRLYNQKHRGTLQMLLNWYGREKKADKKSVLREALEKAGLETAGLETAGLETAGLEKSDQQSSKSSIVLMTSEMSKIGIEETCSREHASIEKTEKIVTSDGDTLHLKRCNIKLNIPRGALDKGQDETISLEALDEVPDTLGENDVLVALTCRCKRQSGVERFNLPVSLKIPHCAKWSKMDDVKAVLYTRVKEVWSQGIPLSTSDTPKCSVYEDYIELWVDHFCSECDTNVSLRDIKYKAMGCTAFLPKKLPPTRKPIMRAYIFNKSGYDSTEPRNRIDDDESKAGYRLVLPELQVCFQTDDDGGDLKISCMECVGNAAAPLPPISEKTYPKITVAGKTVTTFYAKIDLKERNENMMFNLSLNQTRLIAEDIPLQTEYVFTEERHIEGAHLTFDDILRDVASAITDNRQIELLGKKLGFRIGEIEIYKQSNMRGTYVTCDGTLKMLRDWNKPVAKADERSALREALEKAGLVRIADEYLS